MRRCKPWLSLAVVVVLGSGVTACSTTEAGTASPVSTQTSSRTIESPSASSTSSASSPADQMSAGEPDPVAAGLVDRMMTGFATTTSLTGTISIDGGGMSADTPVATFGQVIDDGRVSALQMELTVPDGSLQMLIVDDRYFVGGDIARQYGGTWLELTSDTTDENLQGLFTTLDQTVNSASVTQYVGFLALATDTVDGGLETLDDGVQAQRYDLTLDLTRLDRSGVDDLTRSSLAAAVDQGVTEIPSSYWIDDTGRLVRIEQTITVGGASVETVAAFGDFDVPLDITVPDPAEVVVAP